MHEKSLKTLEYPTIIEKLAHEAAFSASKALARALLPSADLDEVRRRLALTTEARRLLDVRADAGVRGAKDVRPHAAAAEHGVVLSTSELLEVLATLRASAYLARVIAKLDEGFPLLKGLAADLPIRLKLEGRIAESISEEGEVLDAASPALRRLRMEIRNAQQRLQERLSTLVNEFRSALQDPIITMRSDRYVLPVRAEARGQVRGIVHDQSSSGATVFVEPLAVVEMNNRLRQLQIEERQEVERILQELSGEVGAEAAYVRLAVELLAEIDVQLAKARYAGLIRAGAPRVNSEGRLRLRRARHPLLTGKVVPIDFWLGGDEARMVVITGPNTGGKTVALKTVGLLCLMAQAGMHVPAEEDSELPIYSAIFADIGDEQSIEQSLSTFSSHLNRIVEILRVAGMDSLVLLDELGAGTDPDEGSALARAILGYLLERHISTVATTHYSELKAFAHEQSGATNASVEFNVETLSPTYRLSIGLPGRSNALAIAARLGLSEEIIERARDHVGSAGVEMEQLLEGLRAERKAAADERYHASMERAEAEYQRRELERRQAETEEDRVRLLNEARTQARRELEQVQTELAQMRTRMRQKGLSEEHLNAMRASVRKLEESVTPAAHRTRGSSQEPSAEALAGVPEVGDTVYVRSMDARGELVGAPNARGEVEVRLGALKVRVPGDGVVRLSRRQARAEQSLPAITLPPRDAVEAPELQIDLRGWRVEDGLEEVERYIHNAYMAGMPFVRILHGKGTGALRQAIRQQLAHHPLVRSCASAEAKNGGDGITVVTLANYCRAEDDRAFARCPSAMRGGTPWYLIPR
ncbi:MAG: endonuclease MutS2 [Ktedonobacterales bacterium]|nr:endonuclease MutS2 [Ktedonobacterales bacterium]